MSLAGELLENKGEEHHERHKAQDDQRHGIVDKQHGSQHARNDHHILDEGHQNIGEHHGDTVGIVGNTSHQLAHRDIVQLLVRQALDMAEYVLTQVGQNLLTNLLQDHGLQIHTDHGYNQNACIGTYHPKQLIQREIVLNEVLDLTDQHRRQQIVGNRDEHDDEHQNKLTQVRSAVTQQPLNQLGVRHVPLILFVVFIMLHPDIGDQEGDGKDADDGTHNENRQILIHCDARLLPLPASAVPPFCGIPRKYRTVPGVCRRLPQYRHQ